MEEQKKAIKLLETANKYDIDKYREIDFFDTHTSFSGTPKRHPVDREKLVLVSDPFTSETEFYEFPVESIDYFEELDTISAEFGKSALRVRIWVKKGTPAIRYEPFVVE